MEVKDFSLTEELVLVDIEASDELTVIEKLGCLLLSKGYVKSTYPKAVQDREKIFPTGLPTAGVGVAIPHTDVEHVIGPAIAIGTLKNTVKFKMMGNPEDEIDVQLVFMLAIKEPQVQLQMLQNLMSVFQKKELLTTIKNLKDTKQIIAAIKKELETEMGCSA